MFWNQSMKHKLFLQVIVDHHRNKKKESGKILKKYFRKDESWTVFVLEWDSNPGLFNCCRFRKNGHSKYSRTGKKITPDFRIINIEWANLIKVNTEPFQSQSVHGVYFAHDQVFAAWPYLVEKQNRKMCLWLYPNRDGTKELAHFITIHPPTSPTVLTQCHKKDHLCQRLHFLRLLYW